MDLITDYGRWYGLPYTICYFYNGFGPRESGDAKYGTLIARFQEQWLQGEALTIVRPGTQRRAFTYVKDLARGIVLAGERGRQTEYALGATTSYSVLEIANAFGGPTTMVDGRPGREESENDADKAREELSWETTVDVIDYIKAFVRDHPRRGADAFGPDSRPERFASRMAPCRDRCPLSYRIRVRIPAGRRPRHRCH